jgi:hypothetical protein
LLATYSALFIDFFFFFIGSKDNPYPAISTKHTDPATQQKIVQILADAQKKQMAAAVAAAAASGTMVIHCPLQMRILS